jgi:ribosomal protein L32
MRKRAKHLRFKVEPKRWMTCQKCGEPKLPHRICKNHADVCALRDEEWEALVASRKGN